MSAPVPARRTCAALAAGLAAGLLLAGCHAAVQVQRGIFQMPQATQRPTPVMPAPDQPSGPDVHSGTAGQDADSLRALTNEDRTYGRVGLLTQPTILYSVYLNEENGAEWDAEGVARTQNYLSLADAWLCEQAARYGADDVTLYYGGELMTAETVDHRFNGEDEGSDFHARLDDLCARLDTPELHRAYGTDRVGFLFFLPVSGSSYTMPHYVEDGPWYCSEYCLLYAYDCYSDAKDYEGPAVYAHEILHLFGAPDLYEGSADYYVTRELVDYVETTWPDAIMNYTYNEDGTVDYYCIRKQLCPVTAYRIGLCDSFAGLERFPALRELSAGVYSDGPDTAFGGGSHAA